MRNKMKRNAEKFMGELMNLAEKCEAAANTVIIKTSIDLFASIVRRTPVDTGCARANWNIDIRYDSEDVDNEFEDYNTPEAQRGVKEAMASSIEFAVKAGTVFVRMVYIYNNLEYIEALEDGHSQQRPNGMVSVSLARFTHKLDKNARKAGFKS